MTRCLPHATADVAVAKADLAEHGYCLIANALSADQVARLRALLIEEAQHDIGNGRAYFDGGGANQRIWHLPNRHEEFRKLLEHPIALTFMEHLIGDHTAFGHAPDGLPQYLLSSLTANVAGPGGEPMVLHADQGYLPTPWAAIPTLANIAWMIDDFTRENGATRIVPGSHLLGRVPDADVESLCISAEGEAGTALIIDGRVWHGTGQNSTGSEQRRAILALYCRPWMRQQENHTVTVRPELVRSASPLVRRLLGFDRWHTLGMMNGLGPDSQMRIGAAKASSR